MTCRTKNYKLDLSIILNRLIKVYFKNLWLVKRLRKNSTFILKEN